MLAIGENTFTVCTYLYHFQVAELRTTLELVFVWSRGIQHDLFPGLVVDVVRPCSRAFHPDTTEGEEYDDQEYIQYDRDANPHQLLPGYVEMAGYNWRGVRRVSAVQPSHVGRTDASVGAYLVHAGTTVGARVGIALVYVRFATVAHESLAFAYRPVVALLAHSAVDTRIRTAISTEFAAFSAKARPDALADVIATLWHNLATAAVKTWRRGAGIGVDLACEP